MMSARTNIPQAKASEPDPIAFESSDAFRSWLDTSHDKVDALWLRIFKKGSGHASVTYSEALDECLCYGWIDSLKRPENEQSWLQRFTPRRSKSAWSKINRAHAERLIECGKMTHHGMRTIDAAKADGRWEAAYDSARNCAMPDDLNEALENNPAMKAFYQTLNKVNVYSILYRLQTATKPETRERRLKIIVEMLERGEVFHP